MKMIFVMIGLMFAANVASAEFKMGFVDTQKAIQESKLGKKAKTEMEKEGEKKKKELDKKKDDMNDMKH